MVVGPDGTGLEGCRRRNNVGTVPKLFEQTKTLESAMIEGLITYGAVERT